MIISAYKINNAEAMVIKFCDGDITMNIRLMNFYRILLILLESTVITG